jgi:hypothetical protein
MSQTKDEQKITIKTFAGLATYFNADLTENVIEIYLNNLYQRPLEDIKKAVEYFINNLKFMPKIADFNEFFSGGAKHEDILSARAELMWSLVIDVIRECSSYKSFTLLDKAARKAIEITGYENICRQDIKEIHWKQRDFMESYKHFRTAIDVGMDFDAPDWFPGAIEQSNIGRTAPAENGISYSGGTIYIAETKAYKSYDEILPMLESSKNKKIGYKPDLILISGANGSQL